MSEFQPPPDEPPPPPPPPPDEPIAGAGPAQRPLLRRDASKHLAGVAGGLADYLGVDAGLLRVAFVILGFLGIGVPLYLVGWVAMPSPSMPRSYIERWFGSAPNPAALIAIAGVILVLMAVSDGPGHDGLGWGLALLFGGWLLFRADARAALPSSGGTTQAPPPSGMWHGAGGTAQPWASSDAPVWTPAPAPPQPRSMLGRLTVGIALASLGVAALLEEVGAVALAPAQYVGLALTIIGMGLVIGAWAGRAYGLIPLGLLLLPVLFVLSITPIPMHGDIGELHLMPGSVAQVEDAYRLRAGQLVLDLTDVEFGGDTTRIQVSVGLGETRIVVPPDVTVDAAVDLRAGEVDMFGMHNDVSPRSPPVTAVDEGTGAGGRLELRVDNGVGKVTIQRWSEELS